MALYENIFSRRAVCKMTHCINVRAGVLLDFLFASLAMLVVKSRRY